MFACVQAGFSVVIFVLLASEDGFSREWVVDEQGIARAPSLYNGAFSTIAFLLGAITSIASGFLGARPCALGCSFAESGPEWMQPSVCWSPARADTWWYIAMRVRQASCWVAVSQHLQACCLRAGFSLVMQLTLPSQILWQLINPNPQHSIRLG